MNLVDTSGHANFQYEVIRSLRAREGTSVSVDAAHDVQAQSILNVNDAIQADLASLPSVNEVTVQLRSILVLKDPVLLYAKQGLGIQQFIER